MLSSIPLRQNYKNMNFDKRLRVMLSSIPLRRVVVINKRDPSLRVMLSSIHFTTVLKTVFVELKCTPNPGQN